METAVIYARVSSMGDRQSTARQIQDLTDYTNRNSYQIGQIFDEHISGAKRNEERKALLDCLEYCESGNANTILISELSRLGRNVDEILATVKRCKDNHVNLFFQKENMSLFMPDGSKNPFLAIFVSILGTCAELERENIRFRHQSGRKHYIETGGILGRKVGSTKTHEQKEAEYRNVIRELKRGTSVRRTAKLCDVSASTVTRLKREFNI